MFDPKGMREDLETLATGHGSKRDARRPCRARTMRGRRGGGDDHWKPGDRALLHHLDRDAAAENDRALPRLLILHQHHADQLVERIMAPDILGGHHDANAPAIETRNMGGAGQPVERLPGGKRLYSLANLALRKIKIPAGDLWRRADGLFQALDPAETTRP